MTLKLPRQNIFRFGLIFLLAILLTGCGRSSTPKDDALNSTATPVSQAESQESKNFIRITANGFEPQEITVKKGMTVTWVNEDDKTHWIASDPHPIHTNLPGFDSKSVLSVNGTFEYIFNRVGEWSYHDHLRPVSLNGVVKVIE